MASTLLLLLAVAGGAAAAPLWVTSAPQHCGHFMVEVAPIDHLESRGVPCALARRIARRWFDVSAFPLPRDTSVLGFGCLVMAQDIQYVKVRCLREPLWVQWDTA